MVLERRAHDRKAAESKGRVAEVVESVTPYQAWRIANAAAHWMAQDAVANNGTCRFDIVALNSTLIPTHIQNAFDGAY
jgi:putative endonuclease